MTQAKLAIGLTLLGFAAGQAIADPAKVQAVEARQSGDGWRFDVTDAVFIEARTNVEGWDESRFRVNLPAN